MMDFRKISIVIVSFGIILIGYIWIDLFLKVQSERQTELNNAITATANLARTFEEHTLRTITTADQMALFLKYQYEKEGQAIDISPYKSGGRFGNQPFVLLSIVNENGDVIVSNQEPFVPSNVKDREHFQVHQEADTGQLFISKPVFGRSSGKWSIQMTRRINKPDGSFGGVVVVSVDPFYFTGFYKQVDLGETSSIALVGRDGIIRARQSDQNSSLGQDLNQDHRSLMEQMLVGEAGHYIGRSSVDGIKRIYSYRALREYPFFVLIGISESEALEEFYNRRSIYYQVAFLLSFIIVGAASLLSYMVLARQKVEKLKTALYKISETASSAYNLADMYRAVHEIIGEVVPAHNFVIAIYDEKKQRFYFPYRVDECDGNCGSRQPMMVLAEYILRTGQPLLVHPYRQTQLEGWTKTESIELQGRYWLGIPLKTANGKAFGVMIAFTCPDGGKYTEKDKYILNFISNQVALVIERKQAEAALRDSRERFEALVKQSSEAMIVFDPDTLQIVEVNAACVRMLGYTEAELVSMKATEINLLSIDDIKNMIAALLKDGSFPTSVARYWHKSGQIVYAKHTGSLIEYQDQRLVLVTCRDITVEHKLQEKIQAEVELAGAVQQTMVQPDYSDERISIRTIYESVHLVSGDFYGYSWSRGGSVLHGYILDVTGHGMATALQTSAISALLNREIKRGWTAKTFKRLNPRLAVYFPEGSYAAIFAFTLDFRSKTLTCVSGGINKFLASTMSGVGYIMIPGSYLGLIDDAEFDTVTIPIQHGDTFYFLTDGIYERLPREVTDKAYCFEETVQALTKLAIAETRHDDCSALCIKIKDFAPLPLYFEYSDLSGWQSTRLRVCNILDELIGESGDKVIAVLGEAVTNGLQHGTKVRVKINKIGNRLILRVRDNGQGFDGKAAVAAVIEAGVEQVFEECLFAEHGRGIPIMVAWLDEVIYNECGNEVMLVKYCKND